MTERHWSGECQLRGAPIRDCGGRVNIKRLLGLFDFFSLVPPWRSLFCYPGQHIPVLAVATGASEQVRRWLPDGYKNDGDDQIAWDSG